ncbi:DEAD/DEAH box helicase [Amnibacterium setariae]|uniref:DEAD/DEAH box helicase n=1 Tax=Amnibacterium setariae TaxID=2306585 RepID=UPI001F375B44|nr:DEAD/DEAH box helicase [Amnibacterium setariae]
MPASLLPALDGLGIAEPFPIQTATLPDSLAGRDVLGRGRTGSGKTLAFALPLVARLQGGQRRSGRPRGLVLAPTRELATQIAATVQPIAAAAGMTVTTVFGGVSQNPQVAALRAGVDILVACPGRLEDLLKQRALTLDGIEITVLDEADHMADMGFLPGVTRLLAATPQGGQRLLFSATLDNGVDKLVKRFLSNPVTHSVDDGRPAVETMEHAVLEVADADGKRLVMEALAGGTDRRILFVRTKHVAKRIAKQLTAAGIPAADLQGNLSQNARERNLAAFSSGAIKVLVATDVAARGVHVDDVALVIHVDPPTEHKAYLHRSGRTARAGAAGTVVTLVLPEQRRDVAQLLRAAGIAAKPVQVTAQSDAVRDLVGEVAPKVAPAPVVVQQQAPARPKADRPAGQQRAGGQQQRRTRGEGVERTGAPAAGGGRRRGSGEGQGERRDRSERSGQAGRSGQSGERRRGGEGRPAAGGGRRDEPRGAAPVRYSTSSGSTPRAAWAQFSDAAPAERRGSRRAGRPAGRPEGGR